MPQTRSIVQNRVKRSRPPSDCGRTPFLQFPLFVPKRQSLTINVSGTKRKASSLSPKPLLKSAASSGVLEGLEDIEAVPIVRESQSPELDDGDQATQKRQPAVNSAILPLQWKGRLGFACFASEFTLDGGCFEYRVTRAQTACILQSDV